MYNDTKFKIKKANGEKQVSPSSPPATSYLHGGTHNFIMQLCIIFVLEK